MKKEKKERIEGKEEKEVNDDNEECRNRSTEERIERKLDKDRKKKEGGRSK